MNWTLRQAFIYGQIVGDLKARKDYAFDEEEERVYVELATKLEAMLESDFYSQPQPFIPTYSEVNDDELTH